MSSIYTCNSCGINFESGENQREHMKTDWHRYNLKRRVANLPAIEESTFNSKLNESLTKNPVSDSGKPLTKREIRRKKTDALKEKKRQLLEKARELMLQKVSEGGELPDIKNLEILDKAIKEEQSVESTVGNEANEKEEAKSMEEPEMAEEAELTEEQEVELMMQKKLQNQVEIPLTQCLFCTNNKTFKSFETNLTHMFQFHGFYIPEQKYLVDQKGLVKYMSEKIGLGNVCIGCNYQGNSLGAVRSHMLAKRHCKVPYETNDEKLEISEFYNFESTYSTKGNADDDEDWEDVSDDGENSLDDDEEEEDETTEYLYHDGNELHLPTGVKVGHRSLQRYYRQDLRPEKILSEGQGTLIAADARHNFMINGLPDPKLLQEQKRVWQTEVKDKKTHSKRAAKFINNQPHYRDQLLQ